MAEDVADAAIHAVLDHYQVCILQVCETPGTNSKP
jgi:hypothetical protein